MAESEIPADIRELASSIVAEIDADWSYDGQAPKDSERRAIADATTAIAQALLAERERVGGAAATYFKGKLVLCHPDMPPHIWDGEKMERVEWQPDSPVTPA